MRKLNLFAFVILALACVGYGQKVGTSLKNMTEIEKAKPKKKEDNAIKKDIRKYLRECGANVSGEDSDEEKEEKEEEAGGTDDSERQTALNQGSYPNNYGGKNKGTYPESYGGKKKGGSDEECDEEEESEEMKSDGNRGRKRMMYKRSKDVETFKPPKSGSSEKFKDRNNDNRRGGNNNKRKKNDDYDESEDDEDDDGCEDHNKNNRGGGRNNSRNKNNRNKNNNRGGNNNKRGGYSFGNDDDDRYGMDPYGNRYGGGYGGGYGGYGGSDFGLYDGWGGVRGHTVYGGRLIRLRNASEIERLSRRRRQAENPDEEERRVDDVQCLSQCVMGYLEMLDDNRVPSETEVMKYLQNKIPNSSIRIKTIREARRCFARLATTDTDDGCQFSKSLAKCMKLEIEEKS